MAAERDAFGELTHLLALFERTRATLACLLEDEPVPDEAAELLATETLGHIDRVREGFRWSLRASGTAIAELRYLLRAADVIDVSDSPDAFPRPRPIVPAVGPSLRAWQHARIIFGTLPRLPAERVTFPPPWPRSYMDVPVPRGAAETELRIEELERTVWNVATGRFSLRRHLGELRRVYGYFDTGAWVIDAHVQRFRRHSR
jgi:hypothetical protein